VRSRSADVTESGVFGGQGQSPSSAELPERSSPSQNVAWIVQMIILAGCLVTGGLAVAAELRGRTERQEVAR
jgi:hypothetical protein